MIKSNMLFPILCGLTIFSSLFLFRHLAFLPGVFFLLSLPYLLKHKENVFQNLPRTSFIVIGVIVILLCINLLWSAYPELSYKRAVKVLPLIIFGAGFILWAKNVPSKYFSEIIFIATLLSCLSYILFIASYGVLRQQII